MSGDFTGVPLRTADRWIAARLQQGRVLTDTDWNINIDGAARDVRQLAADTIGPAGVPTGSPAFAISFARGALTIGAGAMWAGGMLARNPADLAYADQAEIAPLPESGLVVVYLDAFEEQVQAAENPAELLDPALDGTDTSTRTRIGWRVRAAAAKTPTCSGAALPRTISTGRLDVTRTTPPVPADPCAPPDDPRSKLPDGLLRIEVLDSGNEATARFAWSYSDGADAVAAKVAGTAVTLAPSPAVTFAERDLVEISTLARRADRRDHGPLFTVSVVTPQAGGDLVTLATPSALAGNPPGTALRRWDGQTVGAATAVPATLVGADTGIAFTAHPGEYLAGDWWGVRVRGSAADAVGELTGAPPDGIVHAMTPLAVVDLGAAKVVGDCRPAFPALTDIRGGTCTVTAFPGDDLQAALDALPGTGGELCLAAGRYPIAGPLRLQGKLRVTITGAGPATVLAAARHEAVLIAARCNDLEITHLRVEASAPRSPVSPPGEPGLLGALTFLGCDEVRVHDVEVWCPDSAGRAQSGIYVAPDGETALPGVAEIAGNRLEIGDQQVGVLVVSAAEATIADNAVRLSRAPQIPRPNPLAAHQLAHYVADHVLAGDAPGGTPVPLPDGTTLRIGGTAQIKRLAADFAKNVSASRLTKARSARDELVRYTAASVLEPHQARIGRASANFLTAAAGVRSIGQGIVVAGSQANRVRIDGNKIVSAIQGIHIGLHAPGRDHLSAQQVVISGNTVESLVPFFWTRQRQAIYVGNAASTTLLDNHAHLTRGVSGTLVRQRATAVEAVRIWGLLGPWLQVRGVDLTGGFSCGVHIEDTGTAQGHDHAVRYVSDVLNLNGPVAVTAPPWVTTERCVQ